MKKSLLISSAFILFIVIIASFNILPGISLKSMSKLYGLDYITIFLILTAQKLLENKNKYAFIFYILGSIVNIILGYLIESPIIIAYSFMSIYIMVKNYRKWKKTESIQTKIK